MIPDPALETIREARRQISRDFGNDAARLIEHYRQMQAAFTERLIPRPEEDATQPWALTPTARLPPVRSVAAPQVNANGWANTIVYRPVSLDEEAR